VLLNAPSASLVMVLPRLYQKLVSIVVILEIILLVVIMMVAQLPYVLMELLLLAVLIVLLLQPLLSALLPGVHCVFNQKALPQVILHGSVLSANPDGS